MSARFVTFSEADTRNLGIRLAAMLRPGDVVFLSGELGAGKSVLARGIAAGLGVEGPMPSPTFTLMQPYEGRVRVHHFDLYRLSGPDELFAAGLWDYLGDGVSLVEWPENALEAEIATARIYLTALPGGSHRVDVQMPGREAGLEELL